MSMRFGFEHRRCAMFLERGTKHRKLLRSVMFPVRKAACRSCGARDLDAASSYTHDAPMALDLQASRRPG